jgi:uncharacterized membrane protein YgcG
MKGRAVGRVLALLLLTAVVPAVALERILSYHSDINIAEDANVTVRENIRVVAEGKQIRRGIYREFPTAYRDRFGNQFTVKFEVLSVTRNGKPEQWHTEKRVNGVRVYAGSSDTFISPGEYDYVFTYRSNRQIGFYTDHDELYWNVTGNGWDFIIERASASVSLPGAASEADITLSGFTGPQGSRGSNYTISVRAGGGFIETRSELNPKEGLTLVMGWPKGVVREPGAIQRVLNILADNLGLVLSLAAFTGSIFYLSLMWYRYGRDPQEGVVFPHYSPPEGYSPASARYINRMNYDDKTFAAAVINLAVNGHLSISCDHGDYTLKKLATAGKLAPGEAALIGKLFNRGVVLTLDNSNHEQVSAARKAHQKALQRDYRNRYFKTNGKLLLPSFLGSLVLFIVILVTASFVPLVFAIYAAVVVAHFLFVYLLKAPTKTGRRLMDKLDGFKLYLEVAEKDDLNLQHPPDMTPQLFEKYLPFAIALGVEQQWAQQFSEVFSRLEAQGGGPYRPAWFSGNFSHSRMGDFTNSVSGKFSSAISSAASPPGSSSGSGGGGFSGGGGGGGGGGGW